MSTMSTLPSRQRTIRGILAWLIRANTTRNLAVWDRGIRVLLPLVIGALWVAGAVSTAVAIPLGGVGPHALAHSVYRGLQHLLRAGGLHTPEAQALIRRRGLSS
jgi:hypothetical protein